MDLWEISVPGNAKDKWFDFLCLLFCGLFLSLTYTNCGQFRTSNKAQLASNCSVKPGVSAKSCLPAPDLPEAAAVNWPGVDDLKQSLCPSDTPASTGALTLVMNFAFEKKSVTPTGLNPNPFRTTSAAPYIHRIVNNNDGSIQHCGALNWSGQVTIALPPDNYDWEVYSILHRGNNKAVVLEPQSDNSLTPYVTAINFDYTGVDVGSLTNPTVSLTALESENSGAYNILRQTQRVNGFLHPRIGACTTGQCVAYEPPDTYIVWERNRPVSFEGKPPSTHTEVITVGGKKAIVLAIAGGDTTQNEDSDEFDDDVISFVYTRSFIKVLGLDKVSNSPENILEQTLPHIANDLGFTYFIQAHTNNTRYYRDTIGDISNSGGMFLSLDFEDADSATWTLPVSLTQGGQGNTRGWQIGKLLYDFTKPGGLSGTLQKTPADVVKNYMENYHQSSEPIPSFKTMAASLKTNVNGTTQVNQLNALMDAYFLDRNANFIRPLSAGTGCVNEMFTNTNGFLDFANNQFFSFTHAGGPLDLTIRTVDKRLASLSYTNFYITPLDFSAINAENERVWESNTYNDLENTQFIRQDFTDLPAGDYMIGVQGNASANISGTGFNFSFDFGGQRYCP